MKIKICTINLFFIESVSLPFSLNHIKLVFHPNWTFAISLCETICIKFLIDECQCAFIIIAIDDRWVWLHITCVDLVTWFNPARLDSANGNKNQSTKYLHYCANAFYLFIFIKVDTHLNTPVIIVFMRWSITIGNYKCQLHSRRRIHYLYHRKSPASVWVAGTHLQWRLHPHIHDFYETKFSMPPTIRQ